VFRPPTTLTPTLMLLDIRLLTVKDYHQMGETGIFDPDERIELLSGQIIKKPVKGPSHSAAVKRIDRILRSKLGNSVLVQLQDPVQLDNYSEPEPDVALLVPNPTDYEDHHPTAADVYLIIEVSDSTLSRDCEFKADLYARSGIVDYWVLDLSNRQLRVFREPTQNGYQKKMTLSENESIALLAFANCMIQVSELLRPIIVI
jgi:Uma2 family endonuclease